MSFTEFVAKHASKHWAARHSAIVSFACGISIYATAQALHDDGMTIVVFALILTNTYLTARAWFRADHEDRLTGERISLNAAVVPAHENQRVILEWVPGKKDTLSIERTRRTP